MKTYTKTVVEGEWFEPELDYDWNQHAWSKPGGSVNPEYLKSRWETYKKIVAEPEGWKYCHAGDFITGGSPIVRVGMYDGWPFYKKTPAIGYKTWLGVEVAFFYDLSGKVRKVGT